MPKPDPENESRDEFIDRCVPMVLEDGAAESSEQAVAICNSMWEDHEKAVHMDGDEMHVNEGESLEDFMGRCLDDGRDEDSCQAIWDHHNQSESDSESAFSDVVHASFVSKIRNRSKKAEPFGYGITTAEPYLRAMLQMEDAGCKTGRTVPVESLLKEASTRLCCALPEMIAEKFATTPDGIGVQGLEPPPGTLMLIRHVLTTDREDRDGDVLKTAGAKLDPKAPLLWQHQPFLPIGKVMRTIEQTANKLTVVSALLDLNELTSDIAKLVEADALRFSHGFRVLDYMPRKNADGVETGGFEVSSFEILEASLVSVPSNVDAEIELWSRGKLESELMRAHAKQFAASQKTAVVVKGVDIGDDGSIVVSAPELQTAEMSDENKETKAGRVISQRNMEMLEEAVADMEEMSKMDMSRPAKALCERCMNKVKAVIDSAKPAEESVQPAVSPIVTEALEAKTTIVEVTKDPDLADVVNFVLGAPDDDLARVKHTLDLVFDLAAYNAAGEEYREFERSIES